MWTVALLFLMAWLLPLSAVLVFRLKLRNAGAGPMGGMFPSREEIKAAENSRLSSPAYDHVLLFFLFVIEFVVVFPLATAVLHFPAEDFLMMLLLLMLLAQGTLFAWNKRSVPRSAGLAGNSV